MYSVLNKVEKLVIIIRAKLRKVINYLLASFKLLGGGGTQEGHLHRGLPCLHVISQSAHYLTLKSDCLGLTSLFCAM